MSTDLLPESIRGGWYWRTDDETFNSESEAELVLFRLDETFEHLEPDGEASFEVTNEGDYTFDGQFLIVRGRQTRTFRAHPRQSWHWYLEGKREDVHLSRGETERSAPLELSEERREAIERLPMRVFVRSRVDLGERGEFVDLIHEPSSGEPQTVGYLYAELPQHGALWVVVSPVTPSIAHETWIEIVRRSYLDVHRDEPDAIERVEMTWSGSRQFETFAYDG